MTLYSLDELPSGKGEKRKYAKNADSAFFAAHVKIINNQPFITADIYKLAIAHAAACKREIDEFFSAIDAEAKNEESYDQRDALSEALDAIAQVSDQFKELGQAIRTRLDSMTVIETSTLTWIVPKTSNPMRMLSSFQTVSRRELSLR